MRGGSTSMSSIPFPGPDASDPSLTSSTSNAPSPTSVIPQVTPGPKNAWIFSRLSVLTRESCGAW